MIVDDCSNDGTWDQLHPLEEIEKRIKLVRHEVNQGKGAALRTGIAHATAKIVIIQDADLEYDPGEYLRVIEPILSGEGGRRLRLSIPRRRWSMAGSLLLAFGGEPVSDHVLTWRRT